MSYTQWGKQILNMRKKSTGISSWHLNRVTGISVGKRKRWMVSLKRQTCLYASEWPPTRPAIILQPPTWSIPLLPKYISNLSCLSWCDELRIAAYTSRESILHPFDCTYEKWSWERSSDAAYLDNHSVKVGMTVRLKALGCSLTNPNVRLQDGVDGCHLLSFNISAATDVTYGVRQIGWENELLSTCWCTRWALASHLTAGTRRTHTNQDSISQEKVSIPSLHNVLSFQPRCLILISRHACFYHHKDRSDTTNFCLLCLLYGWNQKTLIFTIYSGSAATVAAIDRQLASAVW